MKYLTFEKIESRLDVDFPDCGSFITFEGKVRADEVDRGKVERIIYESYIEMAEKEFEKIEKEASEKFKVKKIIIKHRVGEIKVGESLFVCRCHLRS